MNVCAGSDFAALQRKQQAADAGALETVVLGLDWYPHDATVQQAD